MSRPYPLDAADRDRWEISGLRHRMIRGEWEQDAVEFFSGFFDPRITTYLQRPDLSRNSLKTYSAQLNTIWKHEPTVDTDEHHDLDALEFEDLWPRMQNTGLAIVAMNEALVRADIVDGRLAYRTITPDCVTVTASPMDPSQLVRVSELRPRMRTVNGISKSVWTWETWDISGDEPTFKIELNAEYGKTREDITAEMMPDGFEGYPYYDTDDEPVMPYVLYHKRLGSHTWSPREGSELVVGTLTVAALWTFWTAGVRDASYPLRILINGKVGGTTPREIDGVRNQEELLVAPAQIIQISDHNGTARLDQFNPAMEPSSMAAAIEQYDVGLAVHAGLSPSDVSGGSVGQSGYAIVVKNKGLRDVQAAMIPAARASDLVLIATAARLANRYVDGAAGLPERPTEYRIAYAKIGASPEERRVEAEADTAEINAGFRDPREGWISRHPGTNVEEATAAMIEAAQFRTLLANPPMPTDAPMPLEDEEPPADG